MQTLKTIAAETNLAAEAFSPESDTITSSDLPQPTPLGASAQHVS